jgi:hypothetical protein
MMIVGCSLGKTYAFLGFIIGIFGVVAKALWAHYNERKTRLLIPFGYFGWMMGFSAGIILLCWWFKISAIYLVASFCFAGPWMQLLGRFRCMIQGCCHGKPCSPAFGIRFYHPKSSVLKIAGLKNAPIHATQVYSILSNGIIGSLLIRLVRLDMSVSFIAGIYFIGNGLSCFAEEPLYGELPIRYWKGMRLNQWLAILSIIGGAVLTAFPGREVLSFTMNTQTLVYAIIIGLLSILVSCKLPA